MTGCMKPQGSPWREGAVCMAAFYQLPYKMLEFIKHTCQLGGFGIYSLYGVLFRQKVCKLVRWINYVPRLLLFIVLVFI